MGWGGALVFEGFYSVLHMGTWLGNPSKYVYIGIHENNDVILSTHTCTGSDMIRIMHERRNLGDLSCESSLPLLKSRGNSIDSSIQAGSG